MLQVCFFIFCCRYVGCAALTYILKSKEKPRPWSLGFFFCCECVGCLASSFDCAFKENSRLGAPKFLCGLLKEVGVLDPNVFFISNGHSKLEASSFFFWCCNAIWSVRPWVLTQNVKNTRGLEPQFFIFHLSTMAMVSRSHENPRFSLIYFFNK